MAEKKVIISPKGALLSVKAPWRRHFLIKAAELALSEGRYTEIMQSITGVTIEMLTQQESIAPQLQSKKPAITSQTIQPPVALIREPEPVVIPKQELKEKEGEISQGNVGIVSHDL